MFSQAPLKGQSAEKFGDLLRDFRLRCKDPRNGRTLSQQRLADMLFDAIGISFSAAAISDWERGKSKIHADDRRVLVGLIKVFYQLGGLTNLEDAKTFLEAGNYRNLDQKEQEQVFGILSSPSLNPNIGSKYSTPRFVLASSWFDSPEEFQKWWAELAEGPFPIWPRVVTASLRRLSDRLSAAKVLRALIWLWLGVIAYILIAPSMRWPFSDSSSAGLFIALYVCASLILPLCIGAMIKTDENPFWKEKIGISRLTLRLYVYQGAFIGFHVGYFGLLAVNLLLYFLHVSFLPWLEFALLAIPLGMGYAAGHVIPYSLWRAYERLDLGDGAIFFVFLVLGPVWGWFFRWFYSVLLTPVTGIFVILSALTITALTAGRLRDPIKNS